jgi:hypothetical protein
MLFTHLYVNITNEINNKKGEGGGKGRGATEYPHHCHHHPGAPTGAGTIAAAGTVRAPTHPLMYAPSLSCTHPLSHALTLPSPSWAPTFPLMHPPSLSCTRPSFCAPAFPLALVHLPTLSFLCAHLPYWWWCCYCSSHCCHCWHCCSCSSSCCCCCACVCAPSHVPTGPPVCVRLPRACPFFCLCTSIYKSIISMLIMYLRLTLL